jgi:N-acetylmuramoyl-L-alanine amidase
VVGALLVAVGPAGDSPTFRRVAAQERSGLTLVSPEGRRELPTTRVDGREMISLSLLAQLFDLSVFEDALAGGLTVSHGGQTIVLAPDQTLASVGGRLVSLPAPAARVGDDWVVPIEFISRALALIAGTPLELRVQSRLLIVGDLRVPRVAVRYELVGPGARVTIQATPGAPTTVRQEADRLIVDFQADRLDAVLPLVPAGPVVESIGMGDRPTALAIGLGPSFASYDVSETPGLGEATRVTIDIRPSRVETTTAPAPVTAEPAGPSPFAGPPRPALQTIVIDPGHGGDEVGARGESGTLEKDVTLAVARRLQAMIESRLGVRVLLTRNADQTVRLDERAAVANNNKADLFLSLHANASLQPSVAGAEVFYLSLVEYGDEAQRLATGDAPILPVFGGGGRTIDLIRWDMAQLAHLDASTVLARTVAERLGARVPVSEPALQQAPFRVLAGANMPAVLVEMGFMTNPEQEAAMATGQFRNSVAQALFESIVRFRSYLETNGQTAPARPALPAARTEPGPRPTATPRRRVGAR